jgi:hypothetical protein
MGRMIGFGVWPVQVEVPHRPRDLPAELVALVTGILIYLYLMAERHRRLRAGIGIGLSIVTAVVIIRGVKKRANT